MSEPIKVGDLVMIRYGTKHGCNGGLGVIFRVTKLRPPRRSKPGAWSCLWCGASGQRLGHPMTQPVAEGYANTGIPIGRLKRIPPLGELEGEKRKEDIREPA